MIEINNVKYYTTNELSKKFGVTKKCIIDWVNKKWLVPKKISSKKFLYSEGDIQNFLNGKNI
jgi:DNA-binding transcriptional MerR regulator